MEILEKLFGTEARVKMLRLFLFNPEHAYGAEDIMNRAKVTGKEVKDQLAVFQKIGLIKSKQVTQEVAKKKGKKIVIKKRRVQGWFLDDSFPYLLALKNLLITVSMKTHEDIAKHFGPVGKIRAVIVSGIFIQDWESRVDLLIVADNLKPAALERAVKSLEAEIGKEIRYAAFETPDFQYRLGIYDKLIRDILDFPHRKVVDKIGIVH
ncbi:hypothetical protein EPO17_03435 [Patescibacteria group bacterium]|nr:MAG: hypothetical protein EPO17_03435 [Patescibacteria group bacterium]